MMDVVVLSEHDSDNSVVEVEIPKKAPPPLVEITEDDVFINVSEKSAKRGEMYSKNDLDPKPDLIQLHNDKETFKEPQLWLRRGDLARMISPNHWTNDMIKFYNDDWGNEDNFSVKNIQREMDQRPYLWKISSKDWTLLNQENKNNVVRCRNCGQPGHTGAECSDPPRRPRCHMCGVVGHISFQCPNAICLNCGNKTRNYHVGCSRCGLRNGRVCTRCSMRGHCLIECPDHWRMYHITVRMGDVVVPPEPAYKKPTEMWCSNCGKKGHYQCHCPEQQQSKESYGVTLPFVVSYEREFYNQLKTQTELNHVLTHKEEVKIKKATRLLNLKQLKAPRDKNAPKKKLSAKAKANYRSRIGQSFKKARLKKKLKKEREAKNRGQ